MKKRFFLVGFGSIAAFPALALYDPKPLALLGAALGNWIGSLTYRDYQKPDTMVTLKTKMTVSLIGPDELVLYYEFDDGPSKTVHSYERMKFELESNKLIWNSGTSKPNRTEYKITSNSLLAGKSEFSFENSSNARTDKYTLQISDAAWLLAKYEQPDGGEARLRSKYEFRRREG